MLDEMLQWNAPIFAITCDKVFALEKDLKKHILVIHDGKKGLGCDTCGKVFPKLSNLTLHIKTVHLKERFYL